MADTWNKKERLKKKQQEKKEKAEKKAERKENSRNGNNLETMLAYVDENGNIISTPPDPQKKIKIDAKDIEIGVPKHIEEEQETERKGIVSFFNESKGYGFIKDIKSGESIFVHANALTITIKENNKVTFETERSAKGLNAINVALAK